MFTSYDEMMKSAVGKMSQSEVSNSASKREAINEMDRLMNNPLQLYLKWFRYNKLVYLDNR